MFLLYGYFRSVYDVDALGQLAEHVGGLSLNDYYLSIFDMQKYGQYPILPNFFNKNLSKNDILTLLSWLSHIRLAA